MQTPFTKEPSFFTYLKRESILLFYMIFITFSCAYTKAPEKHVLLGICMSLRFRKVFGKAFKVNSSENFNWLLPFVIRTSF